jgi:hypothetical protein
MAQVWSEPSGGLRLGASVIGDVLTFALHNGGDTGLRVLSEVDGDLDWYAVRLDDDRVLHFVTDRDESSVTTAGLAPGDVLTHDVDLAEWASPGSHTLECTYEVDPETASAFGDGVWSGALRTPPVAWVRA